MGTENRQSRRCTSVGRGALICNVLAGRELPSPPELGHSPTRLLGGWRRALGGDEATYRPGAELFNRAGALLGTEDVEPHLTFKVR
jgi:hypothetical protein